MIDYKLILILVLSIVLFFVYNKVEELRDDINELKKKNKENKEKNVYNSDKTSDELLKLFKNQNLNPKNSVKQQKVSVLEDNMQCDSDKCKFVPIQKVENFPIINNEQKLNEAFILERDNTESYNATEQSDSLGINYEKTTSDNRGYVIYSNDKDSNKKDEDNNVIECKIDQNNIQNSSDNDDQIAILNVDDVLDNIKKNNNIFLKTNNEVTINSNILNNKPNELIDSSNSDKNNDYPIECSISNSSDSDSVINELNKIQILEDINGKIILKNKDEDESESENDDIEDNDIESIDGGINTSEFQKINLTSISNYKLNDLQSLAQKFDIGTKKKKNGKDVNKTKKELYTELSIFKEN